MWSLIIIIIIIAVGEFRIALKVKLL